jgi:hypothetical protein
MAVNLADSADSITNWLHDLEHRVAILNRGHQINLNFKSISNCFSISMSQKLLFEHIYMLRNNLLVI